MIVQEYAPGGDLFKLVYKCGGRLNEKQAVHTVLQPVLASLQYLHMRGIVHRDLKVCQSSRSRSVCAHVRVSVQVGACMCLSVCML